MEINETADLWKVWRQEWMVQFAGSTEEACWAHFKEKFEGRVRPDDAKIHHVDGLDDLHYLQLKLWNVKAECKTYEEAERVIAEYQLPDTKILPRNSREEHELRDYSVKKLLEA